MLMATCISVVNMAYSVENTADVRSSDEAVIDTKDLIHRLDAQQKINAQLRKRIEELEKGQAGSGAVVSSKALDDQAKQPDLSSDSTMDVSAIEQTLVSKGVALLPVNSFRLTPRVTWQHYGSSTDREDSYVENIGLDAGLPWGVMASIQIPYVEKNYFNGNNKGIGDASFSLSKQLNVESDHLPAVIVQAGYKHDNGKDPFVSPAISSGFRTYTATVSTVKRISPIAVYGSFSATHSLDAYSSINQSGVHADNSYSLATGVSFSATPTVSLYTDASFRLPGKIKWDGQPYDPQLTVGYLTFGSGFLLSRSFYLDVSVAAGVTKDANSFVFSVALPYRF